MDAEIWQSALHINTCRIYRVRRYWFQAKQSAAAAHPDDPPAIGKEGEDIIITDQSGVCL